MEPDDLDEILDRIDEIEIVFGDRDEKIAAYEAMLPRLTAGSQGWAEVLIALSDHHLAQGRAPTALTLLEEVRVAGIDTSPSIEAHLFSTHLAAGNEAEAMTFERALRKRSRDTYLGDDYSWIGESLEEAGRLQEALRWYSMANRDIDPEDLDQLEFLSLSARLRVRQELGLPEDAYDVSARELREANALRWQDSD